LSENASAETAPVIPAFAGASPRLDLQYHYIFQPTAAAGPKEKAQLQVKLPNQKTQGKSINVAHFLMRKTDTA
jgi:hypothetical protein